MDPPPPPPAPDKRPINEQASPQHCPVCDSKFELPQRTVTNSPTKIGVCISLNTFREMKLWRAYLCDEEERSRGLHYPPSRSSDVSERIVDLENPWTLWLVRQVGSQGECVGESPLKDFSIKLHISPVDYCTRESTTDERCWGIRGLWLCLGKSSEEDWHKLRQHCLDGTTIDCALADSSSRIRFNAQLRRLDKPDLFKRRIWKLLGKCETVIEKHATVLLCVDVGVGPDENYPWTGTIEDTSRHFATIRGSHDAAELLRYLKDSVNMKGFSSWAKRMMQKVSSIFASENTQKRTDSTDSESSLLS